VVFARTCPEIVLPFCAAARGMRLLKIAEKTWVPIPLGGEFLASEVWPLFAIHLSAEEQRVSRNIYV
jgi:hypothetical protein